MFVYLVSNMWQILKKNNKLKALFFPWKLYNNFHLEIHKLYIIII